MNILANNPAEIGAGDALIVALLGYGVVFLGLILLMVVVILVSKAIRVSTKKQPEEKAAATAAPAAPAAPAVTAPGAAGKLKIYDLEPKTAAMIMAITADKLGKPLNELRFISIKEVK